jgi:hypothetical protein
MLAIFVGAGCGALRGASPSDGPAGWQDRGLIARIHFAGAGQIAADPAMARLNEIAAMPETTALREHTFRKLAVAPFNFLRDRAATTNDGSALIRPLLDDLFRAESFLEALDGTNEFPELAFALRLDQDRARLWSSNIASVLADWTAIPVTAVKAEGFDGWELRKHHDPKVIRFFRAGNWIVLGWGGNKMQLEPAMLKRIRETTRPSDPDADNLLDAWFDWPALARHHLAPASVQLPAMRLLVQGKKDFLRSQLTMKFAAPLGLKLNPWQIPTNIIRNPIVSFTATRGLMPLLDGTAEAKQHHLPPLPEQVYAWSLSTFPMATYLVAPVTDASNYFDRLRPGLMDMVNAFLSTHGPRIVGAGPAHPLSFTAVYRDNKILIPGMPYLGVNLGTAHDADGEYLLGGLLPEAKGREPVPPELPAEVLAHTNLVYYGWELSSERLKQWHGLFELGQFILSLGRPDPLAPAHKWTGAIAPKLDNSGTEVSLTAPDELTLVRNSTVGLTAIELTALAYWLDSPEFPLGTYGEAPRWKSIGPRPPPGLPPPGP